MSSIGRVVCILTSLCLLNLKGGARASAVNLTRYVNPFIGTEGQGNPGSAANSGDVFPGAAMPFGVVKFGVDTTAFDWTNVDSDAGYTPDGYGMLCFVLYVTKIFQREYLGEKE